MSYYNILLSYNIVFLKLFLKKYFCNRLWTCVTSCDIIHRDELDYCYNWLGICSTMGRKTAKKDNNTIWCEWCKTDTSTIRFDKHVESCQSRHHAEIERKALLPMLKKKRRLSSPVLGVSLRIHATYKAYCLIAIWQSHCKQIWHCQMCLFPVTQ